MTTIMEELVSYLATNVSSAGNGFPQVIPQDESLPAYAYQRIPASGEQLAHDGPTGLITDRIQITQQGETYAEAVTQAEAIKTALDGFKGTMGALTVDYCHVRSIDDEWSASRQLPVARLDISIQYR